MLKAPYFALSRILVLGPGPASAGWVIKGPQVTVAIRQNTIRAGCPYRKRIYDLNKKQLIFVHFALTEYWRGSPVEFKNEIRALNKRELLKSIRKLPPRLQKAYTHKTGELYRQTPDQRQYKVFVISRRETVEVAGYRAVKTEIWINDTLKEEIWQADIPGLAKEWDPKIFLFMSLEMSIAGYQAWQRRPQVIQARIRGLALKSIIHTPNGKKWEPDFLHCQGKSPRRTFQAAPGLSKGHSGSA
ncbi:hypothetical protein [Dethiosulfatarculus sandiegensis]|uniref:Uncharacterized protein n=1 Tax=Dethiosulfatarculus sandiegensis TaxID=1429043 RepID=A0A0D2JBV9_9BACT|nr:hypothetical protein [Dethiosulfatarculus sandiegensis]KIX13266.1 hypothetical protein X474_14810 [Dethiosulfatarculus sandiegensis]